MWKLDNKKGWAPKNWCFGTVVLESPLDCKEIKPVHPKGNQSWILIGRPNAEAETPILWPPNGTNWLTHIREKTLMLGMIEGRRRSRWQRMRWLDGITDSWTWVWVNSGSCWWTGRPGLLYCKGSQRVGHDWATKLNWTELNRGFYQVLIHRTSAASIVCKSCVKNYRKFHTFDGLWFRDMKTTQHRRLVMTGQMASPLY